jgi:hypothetical protein
VCACKRAHAYIRTDIFASRHLDDQGGWYNDVVWHEVSELRVQVLREQAGIGVHVDTLHIRERLIVSLTRSCCHGHLMHDA